MAGAMKMVCYRGKKTGGRSLSSSSSSSSSAAAVTRRAGNGRRTNVRVLAAGAPAMVPDMAKRNTMNLLLLGAVGAPAATMAGSYLFFFFPAR